MICINNCCCCCCCCWGFFFSHKHFVVLMREGEAAVDHKIHKTWSFTGCAQNFEYNTALITTQLPPFNLCCKHQMLLVYAIRLCSDYSIYKLVRSLWSGQGQSAGDVKSNGDCSLSRETSDDPLNIATKVVILPCSKRPICNWVRDSEAHNLNDLKSAILVDINIFKYEKLGLFCDDCRRCFQLCKCTG